MSQMKNEKQTEFDAEIKLVHEQIGALQAKLTGLCQKRRAVLIATCGVKVGEIVRVDPPGEHNNRQDAIVRDITHVDWGKAWIIVSFRKKDGSWAKRTYNCYEHWEKKSEENNSTRTSAGAGQ